MLRRPAPALAAWLLLAGLLGGGGGRAVRGKRRGRAGRGEPGGRARGAWLVRAEQLDPSRPHCGPGVVRELRGRAAGFKGRPTSRATARAGLYCAVCGPEVQRAGGACTVSGCAYIRAPSSASPSEVRMLRRGTADTAAPLLRHPPWAL